MGENVVRKNSDQIVYNGHLIKGETRKGGTQVAFKNRRKFFVLRCIGSRLLTMTEYKDEKDFRKKKNHTNIDSYNSTVKVHKLQMEVMKHKTADILCIVQNKCPLYLATSSRSELDAWYNAFNTILVELGWKEPTAEDGRPASYPQKSEKGSTDQVNGDRYSSPAQVEGAFQEETPSTTTEAPKKISDVSDVDIERSFKKDTKLDRFLTPPGTPPSTPPPRSPRTRTRTVECVHSVPIGEDVTSNEPSICCSRHHVISSEPSPSYINLHPIENEKKWMKEVVIRREKLADVKDFNQKYVSPPSEVEALKNRRSDRRRSKSTPDISRQELEELQQSFDKRQSEHPLFEDPESSDEDNRPPLPVRTLSGHVKPTPAPRQRREGHSQLPSVASDYGESQYNYPRSPRSRTSGLDVCIESPYDHPRSPKSPALERQRPPSGLNIPIESPYNIPRSPNVHSPTVQGHVFDYNDTEGPRRRNVSDPVPPSQHTYVNMSHGNSQKVRNHQRSSTKVLDVSRRPLPCPTTDRPASFVHNLQWEQDQQGGIPIAVPKEDLEDTLALVKIGDNVWIAGKKRVCPKSIAKTFHVGDQLRQINEQIVFDVSIAHALFKTTAKEEVILTVKRLPFAKIVTMKRHSTDEPWGIEMEESEGNRIKDVRSSGPAAEAGIKPRPEGALSKRLCSWIVTHINNISVPLQCPRDEVTKKLDTAELELSLVLQPQDFITKLKHELIEVPNSINYL